MDYLREAKSYIEKIEKSYRVLNSLEEQKNDIEKEIEVLKNTFYVQYYTNAKTLKVAEENAKFDMYKDPKYTQLSERLRNICSNIRKVETDILILKEKLKLCKLMLEK